MKRCPTCKKAYSDQNLTFCVDDGTPLVTAEAPADETAADEATQVRSSSRGDRSGWGSSGAAEGDPTPAYKPPGSYVPPGAAGPSKRRAWPWVLGFLAIMLLVIAGLGFAAWRLVPNLRRAAANSNTTNANVNVERRSNSNTNQDHGNSNSSSPTLNENSNNSDVTDSTPPPTDHDKVLADLKDLEDEWTVANINADKKKLDRILADDYVGTVQGKDQGKAEYLKTIERDTAIQHWEFEDLKVTLSGDRAALSGFLRVDVKDERGQNQQLTFKFTDKFVWRDGRWQATASAVEPVPEKPGTTL